MDQDTKFTAAPQADQGNESGAGQNPHKKHRSHRGGRRHHSGGNNGNRQTPAQTVPNAVDTAETASGSAENDGERNRHASRNGNNINSVNNKNGGNNGNRNRNNRNRNKNANRGDQPDRENKGNRRDRGTPETDVSRDLNARRRTNGKNDSEWVNMAAEEVLPEVSLEELAAISESVLEPRPEVDPGPTVPVVGVRFNEAGKVYYFAPGEAVIDPGTFVIVETARGPEYGEVVFGNREVREKAIIQPLRPVLRLATPDDTRHHAENLEREKDAFKTGLERIAAHKLDMKLVDVQYAFDRSKLLFYFTSAGRVDFRELVKDLASIFRTRIELRQIGIRDEAKMLGGIGACGRALCCTTFLPDFAQVSIKMAKEQNLSLNSSKVSGSCGRLMCCLNYEYQTYVDALHRLPTVDSTVRTPEGEGRVIGISALAETVKVSLPGDREKDDRIIKIFPLAEIELINRAKKIEND